MKIVTAFQRHSEKSGVKRSIDCDMMYSPGCSNGHLHFSSWRQGIRLAAFVMFTISGGMPGFDLPPGHRESAPALPGTVGRLMLFFEGQERKVKVKPLEIVYLSPGELTPYDKNTRKHAPDDIEQIKKSILDDGFNDPIGIWGEQNIIVEGHGRQIAALELNLDQVPCIRLDHMTDDQRRDYAIRHNRTAELSAWDFGKLEEELAALEIYGHDFSGLNFARPDIGSLDDLFAPAEEKEKAPKRIQCPHCGEWFEQ
jgi:hypothetical protein